ncbi:MAG: hypothetical protein ABJC09_07955, partial [Terriglobia bacterium]
MTNAETSPRRAVERDAENNDALFSGISRLSPEQDHVRRRPRRHVDFLSMVRRFLECDGDEQPRPRTPTGGYGEASHARLRNSRSLENFCH